MGFEYGPPEWTRCTVGVRRTVFIPEVRLPSGQIHKARRVSKSFGRDRLDVEKKSIQEQDDQLIRWAAPKVAEALAIPTFRDRMIEGTTRVAVALDKVRSQLNRTAYERVCQQLGIVPLSDWVLSSVKGGDRLPREFPYVSAEEAIAGRIHFYRQCQLDLEPPPSPWS